MGFSCAVHAPRPGVRVVEYVGAPSEEQWPTYAAAYADMLHGAPGPFVLVFDLRQLQWDLGSIAVFAMRKLALTRSLKAQSTRVIQGVVVHTASPILASIVTWLVRAGGQTAPFTVHADADEVERRVRNLETLVRAQDPAWRRPVGATRLDPYVPSWGSGSGSGSGSGPTWACLNPVAFVALLLASLGQRLAIIANSTL